MTLKMKLDNECGRCGKTTTVETNMEGAKAHIERDEALNTVIAAMEVVATELDVETAPELIVFHRYGGKGAYKVETLNNLCSSTDTAKRKRGCSARVKNLLDEVFARVERPPTKKVAKKSDTKEKTPDAKPKKG